MNDFYVVRQRPSFTSERLRVFPLPVNSGLILPSPLRIVLRSSPSSYSSRAAVFAAIRNSFDIFGGTSGYRPQVPYSPLWV